MSGALDDARRSAKSFDASRLKTSHRLTATATTVMFWTLIAHSPAFANQIGIAGGNAISNGLPSSSADSLAEAAGSGQPTNIDITLITSILNPGTGELTSGVQVIPKGSIINAINENAPANKATPDTHIEITFTPPNAKDPQLFTIIVPNDDIVGSGFAIGKELTVVGRGPGGAFRWTPSLGIVNIAGIGSAANAVNVDGTIVVGQMSATQFGQTGLNAFRWTQALGAMPLGTLQTGGGLLPLAPFSSASGVSDDGTVVAGTSQTDSGNGHAFRWVLNNPTTGAGSMSDLGTLVPNLSSTANAISGDGNVIVGQADALAGTHAFVWTQAAGMQDIGTAAGRVNSAALATNRDGSVVVGTAWSNRTDVYQGPEGTALLLRQPPIDAIATRWTKATGNQDLNSLLAAAGVSLNGLTLLNANAISPDGQFISGQAVIIGAAPFSATTAYTIRYCDPTVAAACAAYNAGVASSVTGTGTDTGTGTSTAGPVIAGITTPGSVYGSLQQIGREQQAIMAHQHGLVAPLFGESLPIGTGSEAGVFAKGGSVEGGGLRVYRLRQRFPAARWHGRRVGKLQQRAHLQFYDGRCCTSLRVGHGPTYQPVLPGRWLDRADRGYALSTHLREWRRGDVSGFRAHAR
jgi:probable HAF family extracellular repeat protein